jgi:hypothetical protein
MSEMTSKAILRDSELWVTLTIELVPKNLGLIDSILRLPQYGGVIDDDDNRGELYFHIEASASY